MSLTRRSFLATPALAAAPGQHTIFDRYFLEILEGYLRNARRTSSTMAVCDFEDGTMLAGSTGRSGKTYDSVSRMLPAMAAWVAGNRDGQEGQVLDAVRLAFRNAFDPDCPDYWLPCPAGRQNQRQVEASIVAWSLWLLRDRLLPRLTSRERANIQAWLASCTEVPVRTNNWAWFTAVNHAARLGLAGRWKEFSGDRAFMLEDLKFLDSLAGPGDGWFTDVPGRTMYDYYNFWVFASHFLYWNRMVGAEYPEWSRRFGARLRLFLEKTPHFFGGNGSHVLFGRSLIYRFGVLTPLVLAYQQKLWPHSPGLLRHIVRRNLEFHWSIGGYDRARGKLRETYSQAGNREICDSYINNGHPYWGMQAFGLFLIPPGDPFWSAPEEPLPVERDDFRVRFEGPRMWLTGDRASGEVRWLQSLNWHRGYDYRDKYTKFVYSSHFPFNILKLRDRAAWDNNLIFRDPKTGNCASRAGVRRGELTEKGTLTEWWAELDGRTIEVTTRIDLEGAGERRRHTIAGPPGVEAVEGSYALGLEAGETPETDGDRIRSPRTGHTVMARSLAGHDRREVVTSFEESGRENVNVIYPRMAVITLRATLGAVPTVLESTHKATAAVQR